MAKCNLQNRKLLDATADSSDKLSWRPAWGLACTKILLPNAVSISTLFLEPIKRHRMEFHKSARSRHEPYQWVGVVPM